MTKISKKLIKEAEEWVAEHGLIDYGGATVKSFTDYFGISWNTYDAWRKNNEAFAEALERGRTLFKNSLSTRLVTSLVSAALGGEHEKSSEKKEYHVNADGTADRLSKIIRQNEKQYTPPNVGAAIFLLTNLDPEHYQNKQNSNITLKKDSENEMTIEEINAEIARLSKADTEQKTEDTE